MSRVEIALCRMTAFHSVPSGGSSVSPAIGLDDPIEDLVLVRDVVVERHRLDAELAGEPSHAERVDPTIVGERDRGVEHARPAQRALPRALCASRSRHR